MIHRIIRKLKNVHKQYPPNTNRNKEVMVEMAPFSSSVVHCPPGVVPGSNITKELRQEAYGVVAGGAGSRKPEEYQRAQIILGTSIPCSKTNMRINWRTNELKDCSRPMIHNDGFDYTENFDGVQEVCNKKIYINLKCVVGKGGSQTRTLRDECYPFVEAQLRLLLKNKDTKMYFGNIFDGDEAANTMEKFNGHLLLLPEYETVRKQVYVGDLVGYFEWFKKAVESA